MPEESPPTEPGPVRSHWVPRTRAGWTASLLFLALMALAQPPVVHVVANRVEPWVLGVPFLYAWLLVVYVAMIGVLLGAAVATDRGDRGDRGDRPRGAR